MEREIKFRAWDKSRGKFSNSGNLMMEMPNGFLWWQFGYGIEPIEDQRKFVLQQFTGLHDKNGKEIYEGDLLKWNGWKYEVVWHQDRFIANKRIDGSYSDKYIHLMPSEKIEVIGNIYENPELLTPTPEIK